MGLLMSLQALFWVILVSWSKAEGERQDGTHSLCSWRACVPNWSLPLRPKLQASRAMSFPERWVCALVRCLQCPGGYPARNHLSSCHCPVGPRNARFPCPGPPPLTPPPPCNHSKAVKGLPFAATKPRAPDVCKAVLQETGTGALQRVSGEPVPACLLGALGRVAVSPRCGSLGGCPMQSGDGPADLTEVPHSSVCAACSVLGVGAAEELGLHWLQSCGTHGCEPDWPRARRGGGVPWQQSQNRDATPGCELCSG